LTTRRVHRSVSGLRLFQKCPAAWEQKYVQGLHMPSGVHAIRGQGPHAAVAHNLSQKITTRVDLPLEEVLAVAAETVATGFRGEVHLTEEERTIGIRNLEAKAKDTAVAMTRFHHLRVSPHMRPLAVEREIRVRPDPRLGLPEVVGRPDLVTEGGGPGLEDLHDHKTKEASPREGEEHYEQGLTMYALLFHSKYGHLPRTVSLDFLVARGHRVEFYHRPSTRSMDDLRGMVTALQKAEASIQAGAFPPTDPSNWWCSEKWCGFWNRCPFVAGRRRREGA
jgi:hypothetical protein